MMPPTPRSWITCAGVLLASTIACAGACGGAHVTSTSPPGGDKDDGAGLLAQASVRLRTGSVDDDVPSGAQQRRSRLELGAEIYGAGGSYGGDPYGGSPYGGIGYATWVPPQWQYGQSVRVPKYLDAAGLTGAIEGTVMWNGPVPGKLKSACGLVDNPTLRVGPDRALRGAIVFIEKVARGRAVAVYNRPVTVGGVFAKRGCSFVPAASIVMPLPGPLAVHGDATRTTLRLLPEKGAASVHELQEGGLVQIEAPSGITRIDSSDPTISAAWVIGLDSPYYAVTDDAGRFRIDELDAGTYDLTAWQPPVASISADGQWSYTAPVVAHRGVTVSRATSQLTITLSPPR